MKNVRFDNSGSVPRFLYEDVSGKDDWIEYKPCTEGLWKNLDKNDFSVELLINPLLNKARHIYNIKKDDGSTSRVGMVFPVSALDTEYGFEEKGASNYALMAFQILLERLLDVKDAEADFSDNFEENICVCVLNLKALGLQNPLHLCINSLRKYGYCYFEEGNEIKVAEGYKEEGYIKSGQKSLEVRFEEPKLYQKPLIDLMLRSLPRAHNVVHRFVLLYQIIETMMEEVALRKINEEIGKLQGRTIPHNDFLDNLKKFGQEKERIREIFSVCQLTEDEFEYFKDPCKRLFALAKYNPDNVSEKPMRFYAFRNQMTHTFRDFHAYPEEVAETVQGFEKVVLTILEKYE